MDSFNIISYFSVALNAEFTSFISRKNTTFTIFFLMYIFLCVAITSRKHEKKKTGHLSRFVAKRQQRDNFGYKQRLKMIILRKGTGASFMTNAFLAG